MDIISHTLTGVAVGTVVSSLSQQNWIRRISIVLFGGFGGALPDLDAISLWSKFDTTIGEYLNLSNRGSDIYFGKLWYSHHAAFHSLLAPLILSIICLAVFALFKRAMSFSQLKENISSNKLTYLAFNLGFVFHLLEDMPTPASVWGGVNLFFPSSV